MLQASMRRRPPPLSSEDEPGRVDHMCAENLNDRLRRLIARRVEGDAYPESLWSTAVNSGSSQWCPGAESNHRHCDFQSHALPTELPGRRPDQVRGAPVYSGAG